MSIRSHGKSLEKKVVRGSETVGRDVKKGLTSAGRKLKHGAQTAGRDAKKAGKRVRMATRSGINRAELRLRNARRAKARTP
ncbi:MAG TPA: hypothetical protein VN842_02430 [Thermoplasmata archaeon]|nr:hypothetical protein [Thermoplasmata archaeon]